MCFSDWLLVSCIVGIIISKMLHVVLTWTQLPVCRFAADFRVMQPYEGFTQMFTVEQQADIVRFMRYIDPAFRQMPQPVQPAYGQASMQQRIPDHPPVPDMPQHMPGHLPFRPQQWRPSHSQWNNRSMPQHAWGGSNSMPHDSGGPPIHQTSTGWLPASSNGRQHMHFAPGPPNVHDQHPASQEGPSKKKETQKGVKRSHCMRRSRVQLFTVLSMLKPVSAQRNTQSKF